jgi:hypothetical protein
MDGVNIGPRVISIPILRLTQRTEAGNGTHRAPPFGIGLGDEFVDLNRIYGGSGAMTELRSSRLLAYLAVVAVFQSTALAQLPDHPVITEVYTDPPGLTDGPVGRDPANQHQSYIELQLPTLAALDPTLNAEALAMTFYEVEGDFSSSGNALVNYRIDLPPFDFNPANGTTLGAILRPPNGVVVIGWVDYVGDPPTDLAGTPSTRVGLINGGITTTTDFTFIALNGAQFTGTTNFPVSPAVSLINMPNEATSGIIQNGSAAYLLVNRDAAGYVELYDDGDTAHVPPLSNADPGLPTGLILGVSALLDGMAGNDHSRFDVLKHPYDAPTGQEIDLENVLPLGGAFSLLVPQIAEASGNGYARRFVDVVKTTEDGISFNEDPIADSMGACRTISNNGPFFPTPGRAPSVTSAPELSVGLPAIQLFDVLAGTTGGPGITCANVGGNFGMNVTAAPGAGNNPSVATFATGDVATVLTGQTLVFPNIAVTVPFGTTAGALATAPVTVSATNANGLDPAVVNPAGATTATVQVLNPTTGLNAALLPFQATAFAAIQGLPKQPGVNNEFLGTSLAQFVADNLFGMVDDERHNGLLLLDPATNLSDPFLVDAMEDDMPDLPDFFVNFPSPAGLDDLVTTILNSAEVVFGNGTYDDNFNATMTAVRAIELTIAETRTSGGAFVPTERVHFADATGRGGAPDSGLSNAISARGFELALLDTNVQQLGTLESGQTDDFGLIVEVGQTRAGAQVVSGEFVFLSFTGGLEGSDIDDLDVPPHNNQTNIIYLDLDLLDSILGCETITRLFVIDGNGGSTVNVIEAFSLNAMCGHKGDVNLDGAVNGKDIQPFIEQVFTPGDPGLVIAACAADLSKNGSVGMEDIPLMVDVLLDRPIP